MYPGNLNIFESNNENSSNLNNKLMDEEEIIEDNESLAAEI